MKKINFGEYITSPSLENQVAASLITKPVAGAFLYGPAGAGKTFLAEALCKAEGGHQFFYQLFPGSREDDLMCKILPAEETISGVKMHDGVISSCIKSLQINAITPHYLILDEWDKTRPSADSFLLDFLQSGRINYNGHSAQLTASQMSALRVFITLNDEREISEPLMRRLPFITFDFLPLSTVKQALEMSHHDNRLIPACCVLYEKSLVAGMSKPATIQELRQLLDAANMLGDRADWNTLVFQFVTKTYENHALLKRVEDVTTPFQKARVEVLEAEKFEQELPKQIEPIKIEAPKMPKLRELIKIDTVISSEISVIPETATGVIELNTDTYNAIAGQTDLTKAGFAAKAEVLESNLVLKEAFTFANFKEKTSSLWGHEGEILITHNFTREQLSLIREKGNLKIAKISENEILGKVDGVELRWTPTKTEIIANLKSKEQFCNVFGHTTYSLMPDGWSKVIFCEPSSSQQSSKIKPERPSKRGKKIEVIHNLIDYLNYLHAYYFRWFNSKKDEPGYWLTGNPDLLNRNEWETKLRNLKNLRHFLDELAWSKIKITETTVGGHNVIFISNKDKGEIEYYWAYNFKSFNADKIGKVKEEVKKCIDALKEMEATYED